MTTILKSGIMVLAIAVVVGGATVAYFNDVESSTGNTFTAGTLNMVVTDNGSTTWNAPFNITGLMPGDQEYFSYDVTVTGDSWVRVKVTPTAGTNPEDIALAGFLENRIRISTDGGTTWNNATGSGTVDSDGFLVLTDEILAAGSGVMFRELTCIGESAGAWTDGNVITGITCDGSSVTNAAQGGELVFDLTFQAVQSANNPSKTF